MTGLKGGSLVHVGNGATLIDRIQTGGPGQLNIPVEKIYELGNYKSIATVRDIPDLTFSLESFDVSTEVEQLLTRAYGGREVADAVTLAGDATVTSATAAFTSADVGRMVILAGVGTGGAEFVSTIASVTNGTTVELADTVPLAATDVDLRITVNGINLANCVPLDVAGQFKAGLNAADPTLVTASVAVPFLYLEQMSYRFGIRDNATQSASLKGDSIFYNPGATYVEEVAGTGAAGQTIVTANAAHSVAEDDARRILSVTASNQRLIFGADYTESYGAVSGGAAVTTITLTAAVPATDVVRIVYSSPNAATYPQTVHADTAVKPAAVKGKDIEIYVGGYDPSDRAGSQANKLRMVQSVNADWRVTLDKDEEFGNQYAVGQDFDVPQTNGSVDIKPRDAAELLSMVRKFTGVTDSTKVITAKTAVPLPLDVVIKHPDTGAVVKRLHVPDSRFTVPGYQGRVNQKTVVTVQWESDSGDLILFER